MAIYNGNVPVAGFPVQRRQSSPVMSPLGAGGGINPSGLVPVNRVQPIAGSSDEVQRMTENRLGTMPPSSFSGAGAGFVPADRPSSPIYRPAVMMSDTNPVAPQPLPPMSANAVADTARQQLYGDSPRPAYANPTIPQNMASQALRARWFDFRNSRVAERRQAMMDRLQQRLPPNVFAALQQRLQANDAARQQEVARTPIQAPQLSRADWLRQNLPTGNTGIVPPGLLGTAG